jgi:hypothetical protein
MLSDAQVAALERWTVTAQASASATQAFVASSTELAVASYDAADVLHPADGTDANGHSELAVSLRDLARAVERESENQRNVTPLTAEILEKLRSLGPPPE